MFINYDTSKTEFMLSCSELGGILALPVEKKEKNLLWSDDLTFAARTLYPTERSWTLMKKAGE